MPPKKKVVAPPVAPANLSDGSISDKDASNPSNPPPDKPEPITLDSLAGIVQKLCITVDTLVNPKPVPKTERKFRLQADFDSDMDVSSDNSVIIKETGKNSRFTKKNVVGPLKPNVRRQQVVNVPEFAGNLDSLYPNDIISFVTRYKEYICRHNVDAISCRRPFELSFEQPVSLTVHEIQCLHSLIPR